MRIIGGRFKGHAIHAPAGTLARPTTDRVRESLFNVIEHGHGGCDGARVLDLFAGSGALGFEALSRGAAFALFVDEHTSARAAIRRNSEALNQTGAMRIFRRDATKLGARPGNLPQAFDLVFCDPPYAEGLGPEALSSALAGGWIAPGALVLLEAAGGDDVPPIEGLTVLDTRRYGTSQIVFLHAEDRDGS